MNATIKRLTEERESQTQFIAELLQAAEAETRDLVDTELRSVKAAEDRIKEIDAQIEPLAAFEQRRAAAVDLSRLSVAPRTPAAGAPQGETRSIGQIFAESEEIRNYNGRGTSGIVRIPEFRALIDTGNAPGSALVGPAQQYRAPEHYAAHPLLSLVAPIEVTNNAVEIVTVGDASGADVVAEGAAKPEVVWTATAATVTLQTVAGWTKFTRQSLQDIPQMRNLVDQKIRRAIDVRLAALASTALDGAFTGGNTTTGASGVALLNLVRTAIAELQDRGVVPTAVLMNPADHADLDIALMDKTLNGAVVYGQVFGLPIIPVSAVTAGTAVVGDISAGLAWFYKAGLEIYTTDSDISGDGATAASDFRANILTTLGEVRGIFAVTDASVMERVVVTP